MIDLDGLTDQLCEVLRWQLANPGKEGGPEVPLAGARVWRVFLALNRTRSVGMSANPISYVEIEAWSRLYREPVRPFELDIIARLDAVYLEAGRPPAEEVSIPQFTPNNFDTMFEG
jgi:hypothetical protein